MDIRLSRKFENWKNFAGKERGYPILSNDGILIILNKFRSFGDSSYIRIPENIYARKKTNNIQYNDNKCFKYVHKLINLNLYKRLIHRDYK